MTLGLSKLVCFLVSMWCGLELGAEGCIIEEGIGELGGGCKYLVLGEVNGDTSGEGSLDDKEVDVGRDYLGGLADGIGFVGSVVVEGTRSKGGEFSFLDGLGLLEMFGLVVSLYWHGEFMKGNTAREDEMG